MSDQTASDTVRAGQSAGGARRARRRVAGAIVDFARDRAARPCWRDERASVVILFAALLPVVLGVAAIVVDAGNWFAHARQAQNAADAAALAGAQDLPSGPAIADASQYVTPKNLATAKSEGACLANEHLPQAPTGKNTPSGKAEEWVYCVTTPYGGSSAKIEVTVGAWVPSILANKLGIQGRTVERHAVAKRNSIRVSSEKSALFAYDDECVGGQGIDVPAQKVTIQGAVHSNGLLRVNGNEDSFGPTTYGGPAKCTPEIVKEQEDKFVSKALDEKLEPWPINYEESPPPCPAGTSPKTGGIRAWKSGENGIFCAKEILVNEKNAAGKVTFYAEEVRINAEGVKLSPYWGSASTPDPGPFATGLIAYGEKEVKINGKAFSFGGGAVFAPKGIVKLTGGVGEAFEGYIEGLSVRIEGKGFTFKGTGPACEGCSEEFTTGSALVE